MQTSLSRFFDEDFFDKERPFLGLNRLFKEGLPVMSPDFGAVDIYEKSGNVVAEINLPGMDADDIDIEVESDSIYISADTSEDKEDSDEADNRKYYAREIVRRSFSRTLPLPQSIKEKDAKAKYEDGVLKITAPKREPSSESVKVKVKK
tara:strand:- start:205 stop:651 length:447 start_codon:yes stop_codon:yes gene_type:complete